ncbi:MAG: hypothetical protein JJD97_15425 [Gemmatimonadaceae bacterium]|nr:hypothetical protein [Gemmatimonadaceae bacterium]
MASASRTVDSTTAHDEAGGAVAPPPLISPRLSPMPAPANAPAHVVAHAPKRTAPRAAPHALRPPMSIAEDVRAKPSSSASAAPPPANNAQFLEELRAIHAEIDARKRHMDSLTKALDSLNRVSKPN